MSGFRQSQSSLHTWSGLIVGWVLFTIFLMGTVSYWRADLNRWMRPELSGPSRPEQAVAGAQAYLRRTAPDARSWFISVPGAHEIGAQLFWQPQPMEGEARPRRRRDTQALVDADGQPLHARDTRGGEFFYRFHFDLHYVPVIWARWFVGFCAMAMLVAIISGVITHKKIFKDFFTFRRGRGQRTWLDGHNATAVLALPFHLMITYTGLVTLMTLYMPWAAVANYNQTDKLFDALFPSAGEVARTGAPAPLVNLVPLMRDASARWGGAAVGTVRVAEPGDAAARVTISASQASGISARAPSISYSGTTGRMIWQSHGADGAAEAAGVMIGLHAGRYAPDLLRWLYFLSGMGGTVMVASGLVLWTVKRREKLPDPDHPHFGFRLVERLNIGFIAGLPLAMTGYLWANRLLPTDIEGRAEWEIHAMFLAWGAALLVGFLRPVRRAWVELFALTGAAMIALPFHDLSNSRGLLQSGAMGDMRMVAMNLTICALGATFLMMARKVRRYQPRQKRSARKVATLPNAQAILEPAE